MSHCSVSYRGNPYPNEDAGDAAARWQRSRKLLTRSKYAMDGHELSEDDNERISEMLYLWAHIIQDCSFRSGILTRNCSTKTLTMWLARLNGCDIKAVVSALKRLLSIVREYNPHNGAVGLKFFQQLVLEDVRKETLVLLEPVWSYVRALVRTGCEDVSLYRDVNTILQFPLRLTLRDVDWVEEAAIAEYLEFEKTLTTQSYPEDIIQDMNREAREVLADFSIDFEKHFPVNGNGATAEVRRGSGESYKFFRYRKTWAAHQMERMMGYEMPWWLHQCSDVVSDADLAAKYQLVPKGIDKKRGVSLEPVTHMYFQQMVFQAMDSYFHQHPELNICLHKQEFNRELAGLGSAILSYGTADLSSASDSVTITLVRKVFEGTPLLPWLLRTRTRFCDVSYAGDTQRVTLEKFAPMGSALCFPVECLIFSLIIRVASKRVGVDRYYRVYGDDMIMHRDVWDEAISILDQLHFIVNLDKSFAPGSIFTESCGIECLNGCDVTPLRISRRWNPIPQFRRNGTVQPRIMAKLKWFNPRKLSHRRMLKYAFSHMSPAQLEGQVEFLNRLTEQGFYSTAKLVYKDIRRIYGDVTLGDAYASLIREYPTLEHEDPIVVYNRRTQALEAVVTATSTTVEEGLSSVNYYLTLQTLARRAGYRLYNVISDQKKGYRLIQAMPPEMVANRKSGSTSFHVVRKRVPLIT